MIDIEKEAAQIATVCADGSLVAVCEQDIIDLYRRGVAEARATERKEIEQIVAAKWKACDVLNTEAAGPLAQVLKEIRTRKEQEGGNG